MSDDDTSADAGDDHSDAEGDHADAGDDHIDAEGDHADDADHVDAEGDDRQHVDHEGSAEVDEHADGIHGPEAGSLDRVTSPMQSYSMRQVGAGFVVLAVGLAVAFVLPLVAA